MSCANPNCWRNPNHSGVGKSPEHPDDITGVVNFWAVIFAVLLIGLTVWGVLS